MPALDTAELSRLISEKLDCLTQLHALGGEQLALIEAGDMGELITLLSAKQRLLQGLQRIEQALDPYRPQAPQDRHWPSAADRQRCALHIERCESLLREIVVQEKRSEIVLAARRDATAAKLHHAHAAHAARGAYVADAGRQISQLDLTSGK